MPNFLSDHCNFTAYFWILFNFSVTVQQILMNFAGLVHVYVRRLTTKFQQNRCRQCWDTNFFRLYILQKLWTQFSWKYILQNSQFMGTFLRFCRSICLVFFWNMLIWVPRTRFCGKLRINFSDILGNLLIESVTYISWKKKKFTVQCRIFKAEP